MISLIFYRRMADNKHICSPYNTFDYCVGQQAERQVSSDMHVPTVETEFNSAVLDNSAKTTARNVSQHSLFINKRDEDFD